MKVIDVAAAKEYVQVCYPNDPLLKAMANALLDRLPSFEVEPCDVSRWIPVTEDLPREDLRVFVWHQGAWGREYGYDTDRLHNGEWVRWGKEVTHWAPAPEWMMEDPK